MNNPLRARLVQSPYQWNMSSATDYLNPNSARRCVYLSTLMSDLGASPDLTKWRAQFRKFMAEEDTEFEDRDLNPVRGPIVGDKEFKSKGANAARQHWRDPEIRTEDKYPAPKIPTREIFQPYFSVNPINCDLRKSIRNKLIVTAIREYQVSMSEVASCLNVSRTLVSKIYHKLTFTP